MFTKNQTKIVVFWTIAMTCSCSNRDEKAIESEWIGKEITIPEQLSFEVLGERIDGGILSSDYKIINYIDSEGCTSCRMKLPFWNETINEFNSMPDCDIEVLTIIHSSNINGIQYLLKQHNYLHPVAIDCDNTFFKTNKLPTKSQYHTFLLDADNQVVSIGNPVLNPKIKELYKHIILLEDDSKDFFSTIDAKPLGIVTKNSAINVKFTVTNPDSITHHIQALIPSCECVTPIANTNSISPGEELTIEVDFEADSIPGRFSKYVDVFYHEKNYPDRLTIYGYINQ